MNWSFTANKHPKLSFEPWIHPVEDEMMPRLPGLHWKGLLDLASPLACLRPCCLCGRTVECSLPGAATAAAPAEAAGVRGVGGGVSHTVARLEDTGSCFLMNLHLSLTHLHPLWAHGLEEEEEEEEEEERDHSEKDGGEGRGGGGCEGDSLEDYYGIKLEHHT